MNRLLSLVLGVVMVVAAVPEGHGLRSWIGGLALAAVLIGIRFPLAAPVAVVLTAVTLVLSEPMPILVVVSGLFATAYLVMRYTDVPNSAPPTRVTAIVALGFSVAGVAMAVFPSTVPWLPLIAPFALLAAFAMAANPYLRHRQKSRLENITAPGS